MMIGGMAVTLEQLEQYPDICREVRTWQNELDALYKKYGGIVKDTVRGSSKDYPYTSHPMTITGVQTQPSKRIKIREERLKRRRAEAQAQKEEIEKFIDGLQDSQLRQIIHYHYIKGYSWVKTAGLVNNKESAVRMKVKRYFE